MSSFMKDVRDEIKALVVATVSGATTNNVMQSITAARENLFEKAQNGQRTLPIWIIDAATFVTDEDWGVDSLAYRAPIRITELRESNETDAQITIQDNLDALRTAMDSGRTNFQVIERGVIDTGPDEETMGPIIDLALNFIAGSLYFESGVLCGTNL